MRVLRCGHGQQAPTYAAHGRHDPAAGVVVERHVCPRGLAQSGSFSARAAGDWNMRGAESVWG